MRPTSLGLAGRWPPKPPAGPGDLSEETPAQPPRPNGVPKAKPPAGPGTLRTPEPADDEVIITPEDERAAIVQPGYVWLDTPMKVLSVSAHLLEFTEEPPQ